MALADDVHGDVGVVKDSVSETLTGAQQEVPAEGAMALEIEGEQTAWIGRCRRKLDTSKAQVQMHEYLLLEGLQAVVSYLKKAGKTPIRSLWMDIISEVPLPACRKFGKKAPEFRRVLRCYPDIFVVDDNEVDIMENAAITYSWIHSYLLSAALKLQTFISAHGSCRLEELFIRSSDILSDAERMVVGDNLDMFGITIESLHEHVSVKHTNQTVKESWAVVFSEISTQVSRNFPDAGCTVQHVVQVLISSEFDNAGITHTGTADSRQLLAIKETLKAHPELFEIDDERSFVVWPAHCLSESVAAVTGAQQEVVGEVAKALQIEEEEAIRLSYCRRKHDTAKAQVERHEYLLLEGLQAVASNLKKKGKRQIFSVWMDVISEVPLRVCRKFGKNAPEFRRVLQSYPDIFVVDDNEVDIMENVAITYSWIHSYLLSTALKLQTFIYAHGSCPLEELFIRSLDILTDAERMVVGDNSDMFGIVIESLHEHVSVKHTNQTIEDSVALIFSKICTQVSRDYPDADFAAHLVAQALIGFGDVGNTADGRKLSVIKETLKAHPELFEIDDARMYVVSPAQCLFENEAVSSSGQCSPAGSAHEDDTSNPPSDSVFQNDLESSLTTSTSHPEATSSSDMSTTYCLPSMLSRDEIKDAALGDEWETCSEGSEVESLGSESISDTESLEAKETEPNEAIEDKTEKPALHVDNILTVLQDKGHFSSCINQCLAQSAFPIISVSSSECWLLVGLWEGQIFAIDFTSLSAEVEGRSTEHLPLGFLSNSAILKVTFNVKQLSSKVYDQLRLEMVSVFDVKVTHNLLRTKSCCSGLLPAIMKDYGVSPFQDGLVSMATLQTPLLQLGYSEQQISALADWARMSSKLVPHLFEEMLSSMTSKQITPACRQSQEATVPHKGEVHAINVGYIAAVLSSHHKRSKKAKKSKKPKKYKKALPISLEEISSSSREAAPSHDQCQEVDGYLSGSCRPDQATPSSCESSGHPEGYLPSSPGPVQSKVLHYGEDGMPTLVHCASEQATRQINPCQISLEIAREFERWNQHDKDQFLASFDSRTKNALKQLAEEDDSFSLDLLTEVIMDVGRKPSARYYQPTDRDQLKVKTLRDRVLTKQDMVEFLDGNCSPVSTDHRAAITGTLHRVGVLVNRQREPISITVKFQHPVFGCITPLFDLIRDGQSVLFLGQPRSGKTTLLREAARVLNDTVGRRVVIVDTLNEIGGDDDIPHPSIGGARRMQLQRRDLQPTAIREVVRNHSAQTIIVDRIETEADAVAALAARQRGIQLLASARGQTLSDFITNSRLDPINGQIRRAISQACKNSQQDVRDGMILRRNRVPAFDVIIEVRDCHRWIIHHHTAQAIDACLRCDPVHAQVRRVVMRGNDVDTEPFPQVIVDEVTLQYPI
ncbi:uncharacterized protein [Diadema setosum]|uniref:uncharacterized protein n=1 Tax=Diadema setosum TaxID=31175 RepID=UPI003B3B5ADA